MNQQGKVNVIDPLDQLRQDSEMRECTVTDILSYGTYGTMITSNFARGAAEMVTGKITKMLLLVPIAHLSMTLV